MKLVVIVPAYNESKTIGRTIESLISVESDLEKKGIQLKVYVINDGSTDDTDSLAVEAGAHRIVRHRFNQGLGAAVRSGLTAARADGADLVVKYDADCQHEAKDVVRILEPILADEADVVYGSRFENINYRMPFIRRTGNLVFTGLMRWLTGWPLRDSQPGIFAVNRSYLEVFYLPGNYNYTQQVLVDAFHKGMRFAHVNVAFNKRETGASFISLKYPFKVLPQIFQVLVAVKPLRTFGIVGLAFLLFGGSVFAIEFLQWLLGYSPKPVQHVNLVMGACLFGVQTFFFGLLADLISNLRR